MLYRPLFQSAIEQIQKLRAMNEKLLYQIEFAVYIEELGINRKDIIALVPELRKTETGEETTDFIIAIRYMENGEVKDFSLPEKMKFWF